MDAAPQTADAAIKLSGVSKRFAKGVVALNGVDLSVARGEFVSVIGPSGCGKSSVLRLIAGLSEPTQGCVSFADGARPDIGFVFQEPTLMPWASALNNVRLPLRLAPRASRPPKAEQIARARDALARMGLADRETAAPRELSGGMKMRVSIARALITQPDVLLMDEPFAALDEITRFRLNDELLALWRESGWTVVFVTHSVYEAAYLASRVIIMSGQPGRVHAEHRIDQPETRGDAWRASPDYARHCARLSTLLREASTA